MDSRRWDQPGPIWIWEVNSPVSNSKTYAIAMNLTLLYSMRLSYLIRRYWFDLIQTQDGQCHLFIQYASCCRPLPRLLCFYCTTALMYTSSGLECRSSWHNGNGGEARPRVARRKTVNAAITHAVCSAPSLLAAYETAKRKSISPNLRRSVHIIKQTTCQRCAMITITILSWNVRRATPQDGQIARCRLSFVHHHSVCSVSVKWLLEIHWVFIGSSLKWPVMLVWDATYTVAMFNSRTSIIIA